MRARLAVAFATSALFACVSIIGGGKYHLCSDDDSCDGGDDDGRDGTSSTSDAADASTADSCQPLPPGPSTSPGCNDCVTQHAACFALISRCRCEPDCFEDLLCARDAGGTCACAAKSDTGKEFQTCLRNDCPLVCNCK